MKAVSEKAEMVRVLSRLSEIPVRYKDRKEALKMISEYCQELMRSRLCTITFVDLEHKFLRQVACASFDKEFERQTEDHSFLMGATSEGAFIDFELLATGETIKVYRLKENGRGVAKPETARRLGFDSLLSHPLKSRGELIGYINHFASGNAPFREDEERLLDIFANHAVNIIDKSDYFLIRDETLKLFNDLLPSLLSGEPEMFLREVPEKALNLLPPLEACVVWRVDRNKERLTIAAASPTVDDEYRALELRLDARGIERHLASREPGYLKDVTRPSPFYAHPEEAARRGWRSLLSAPMWVKDDLIGMLDVYTRGVTNFDQWHVGLFKAFAAHVALSMQKAAILAWKAEAEESHETQKRLAGILMELTETRNENDLLSALMRGSLDLVRRQRRGWISRLDFKSGSLDVVFSEGDPGTELRLKIGEGVTGEALSEERPVRVDDVSVKPNYVEFWKDTRSELAIPMIVMKADVRVGGEVRTASKQIGVLNLESSQLCAYTQFHENCLWPLARQAALRFDRFEFDHKLNAQRDIARQVVEKTDYDSIVVRIMHAIQKTLQFEYVNISLVNRGSRRIRSEYVDGVSKYEQEKFKERATYTLESDTVHDEVLRTGDPFVCEDGDARLDAALYRDFRLHGMIRLFMPMRSSHDRQVVIGTVEVGYKNLYRKHIYERDVQVLEGFVDYVAWALEQKKSGRIERISHDFIDPIIGVRNNTDYLVRKRKEVGDERVLTKLEDILSDCDILLHHAEDLGYILGRPSPASEKAVTLVFRDIIIKTINQLRPEATRRQYSPAKMTYNPGDSYRIRVEVDRVKLNRVAFNLLSNSIKYAEADKSSFKIRVELDENKDNFIIKFRDWGIGVRPELKEKIFKEYFRADEAKDRSPLGSGLGLAIARSIMREIGGDVVLAGFSKPTEFHMVLPKKPK